eukprot:CAMPEP_0177682438 /NCGR_PEP_ID=MMETSP0447-20121125/31260_1 /TAXON_ID=0 /ORGANISM="Stygamoeba regulata, Strain BSH-02190019" /LENGTH=612 /DNA_ID=CAMNT_0019191943 /DNA_START=145 /DNA_END=1980 /DNA_ORIENTATION=+
MSGDEGSVAVEVEMRGLQTQSSAVMLARAMTELTFSECNNPASLSFPLVNFEVTTDAKDPEDQRCVARMPCCGHRLRKQILFDVSATVLPGELLAIIGPSGAGKTTLLNILARRTAPSVGKVLINGQDLPVATFRRTVGYVPQTDALVPSMTVRETLNFYAALKLPRSLSARERSARVNELLEEFGLTHAAGTYIGGPTMPGISGGQRRRVSIAIEMLSEPSCLLLDEPTSGLDAATAMTIMHTILGLARTGRTVICTIHQPRSSIWHLFDRFMLLCDGRVVYCGAAKQALGYFEQQGFPCPTFSNPADHFIDMVTASPTTGQSEENVELLKDAYSGSPMHSAELERLVPEDRDSPLPHRSMVTSGLFQTLLLTKRSFLDIVRNPLALKVKLIQTIFTALLLGLVFLRLNFSQEAVQSRVGVLSFFVISAVFQTVFGVASTFPIEKQYFDRDREAQVYSVLAFYISKVLADLPFEFILPILQGTILYWMANLNPSAERFFIFLAIIVLLYNVTQSLGLFVSAIAPTAQAAMVLAPLVCVVFVLFGGFFANQGELPVVFRWIPWISLVNHSFRAMMTNEFTGLQLTCEPDEQCVYPTGDDVLDFYGFGDNHIW